LRTDGLIATDPAAYARLPKIHAGETRTQGLDRLELSRSPAAQTLSVHHGALALLLGSTRSGHPPPRPAL